jgi:hypothetical protein
MNANPELASAWKGRILMQITAEKVDRPYFKKTPVSEKDRQLSLSYT